MSDTNDMKHATYITQSEAAGILGVTERTLQRWVKDGDPHPRRYRVLGRLAYRRQEVERFRDRRERECQA